MDPSNAGEAGRSITPSGGYGELGTVEEVEPGSAVLDEGGLAVVGVCRTYGKAVRIRSGAWSYKTPAVPFLAVLPMF